MVMLSGSGKATLPFFKLGGWGGGVARWCWINFQCGGVLLIRIRVGQGLTVLTVGAGGGCLDIFTLIYYFSFLSPSLGDGPIWTEYCLKGLLSFSQYRKELAV